MPRCLRLLRGCACRDECAGSGTCQGDPLRVIPARRFCFAATRSGISATTSHQLSALLSGLQPQSTRLIRIEGPVRWLPQARPSIRRQRPNLRREARAITEAVMNRRQFLETSLAGTAYHMPPG
jgi:hypothetical protein